MRSAKTRFVIDGEEVTEKEFNKRRRSSPEGCPAISIPASMKPSWAAAVHPKNRASADEFAKKTGSNVKHDELGRPCFDSLKQQRKYLAAIGWANHDDVGGGHPTHTYKEEDFEADAINGQRQ